MAIITAFISKVPGKRPVDRPRRKWLDVITADLNDASIDSVFALNRNSWKTIYLHGTDPAPTGNFQ